MIRSLLCLSFLFAVIPLFTQQSIERRIKGLDKKMEEILEITKAAGFAVAVVEKEKIIYERGFGYRDYENKVPADENTLFAIGSSSKAFTAAQMGILENEGKLSLDDSPSKYLPKLRFFNDELNSKVQIMDFMCHRSGIPRHDFSWYLFPTEDRDSLLSRMEYMEPFAELREQWYYNNFGFLIQGRIGEVLTGKTWEENMDEFFFTPLGMERSNCTIEAMESDKNAALGYFLDADGNIKKADYYKISGMAPAGAINSSVHEMTNWVRTWIHKGKFGDKVVFPEAYADNAISAHMVIGGGLPGEKNPDLFMSSYGFGWMLSSYRGHYRVEHGGNIDGFSANVCFYPTDSLGIIVLSNQSGSSVPYLVRNTISDLIFGIDEPGWINDYKEGLQKREEAKEETEESSSSGKIEGTNHSHALQAYAGNYFHPAYGYLKLSLNQDSLFLVLDRGDSSYLEHFHFDVFQALNYENGKVDKEGDGQSKLNFKTDLAGEISGVEVPLEPTIEPILFEKLITEVAVSESVLADYIGEYELAGMTAKFYTKGSNILYLFVPGQPEYELVSLGDDLFALKILDGFKVEFERNDSNQVDSAVFRQPNGVFKAKRKPE